MRTLFGAVIGVSMLMLVACPKEQATTETKAEPAKTAASQPATTGSQQAPAAAMAGARKMEHCPSSVPGATTKIEDAADGVVVVITGADDAAAAAIREDAKHLVAVSVKNPTEIKHSGEGEGGGGLGNCPVVLADTTITAEDVPGGAKVTVKPAKAEDLAKLKQLANDRLAKMAAPK
jgi:hypothetical protein